MQKLVGVLRFYIRFLPSFTRPGFLFRKLFWRNNNRPLVGQIWLVSGASGGIGKAICESAAARGAKIIAVARNQEKLNQLKTHVPNNLLGHFLLTETLKTTRTLAPQATVISMSSGGMYNVPLMIEPLEMRSNFSGMAAYAFHKRAQLVLTDYWRANRNQRRYYVMHPGWVDTQGVKTSLPRFRKLFRFVLRESSDGADTALWLASVKPEQKRTGIWFDRALRPAHLRSSTEKTSASAEQLVTYLEVTARRETPSEVLA